jgi:hypothetical protein
MIVYGRNMWEGEETIISCIVDGIILYEINQLHYVMSQPVTVAEWSKPCTVFARSEAAIVGSNPTQGMDV